MQAAAENDAISGNAEVIGRYLVFNDAMLSISLYQILDENTLTVLTFAKFQL